jgi:hypothetical protein
MRELIIRIIRRSVPVVIALAIMGYILGQALLFAFQYFAKNVVTANANQANREVLWRAPLGMASLGVILVIVFECVGFAIKRRKLPAQPIDSHQEPAHSGPAK